MSESARPDLQREGSEYFTPPLISPGSASTPFGLSNGGSVSMQGDTSELGDARSPIRSGREFGGGSGSGSREGSPTPVKVIPRRPSNTGGITPTRPPPRASNSGSASRIPVASASGLQRRSPAPPTGEGAVPAPRSVSHAPGPAQAGPSRIPRSARRVSGAPASTPASASGSTASTPGAEFPPGAGRAGGRTSPKKTQSTFPPSRIPVASPRRRPNQLPDTGGGSPLGGIGARLTYGSPPGPGVSRALDDEDSPFRATSIPMTSAGSSTSIPRDIGARAGSRRASYVLSTSASSDGSRTGSIGPDHRNTRSPGGSDIGSRSRRPSGPRDQSRTHTPRASVSSFSHPPSDDGRRGDRASESSASRGDAGGDGETELDETDLFFSGGVQIGERETGQSSTVLAPFRLATPVDLAAGNGSQTGVGQGQLHIDIPRRMSSVSPSQDDLSGSGSNATSPLSFPTSRPPISPRRSSRLPPSPPPLRTSMGMRRDGSGPVSPRATAGGGVFDPLSLRLSRSALDTTPPPERPPQDAKRRASKAVQLGAAMDGAMALPPRRSAPHPPMSSTEATARTRSPPLGMHPESSPRQGRRDSDFMPGSTHSPKPSRVGRRNSQISHGSLSASEGPSPTSSPYLPADRAVPQGLKSPPRNRQNLTVDTSRPAPSAFPFQSGSMPTSAVSPPLRTSSTIQPNTSSSPSRRECYAAQPSPPVPSKNPLRHLSRPGSASSSRPDGVDGHRRTKSGSTVQSPGGDSPRTGTPGYLNSPMEVPGMEEAAGGGLFDQTGSSGSRGRGQGRSSGEGTGVEMEKRASGDWGWGAKRQGRILGAGDMAAVGAAVERNTEQFASPTDIESIASLSPTIDKSLPDTPPSTGASSASTFTAPAPRANTEASDGAGEAADVPNPAPRQPHTPSKSPSMPLLGHGSPPVHANPKASRLLGLPPSPHPQMRSGTDPMAGQNKLLPPPMLRSPTSPNIVTTGEPTTGAAARPPSTQLSKRSHLIREIAMTERAYANDLALIRDAFMPVSTARQNSLRPPSLYSVADSGTSASPGTESTSARSSMFAAGRRGSASGSGHSTQTTLVSLLPTSPMPKSPYGLPEGTPGAYFGSTASLSPIPHSLPSPRTPGTSMGPPTGKPLSPNDIRAIFLNIDQLAAASEDLAVAFERAIGEDDPATSPGVSPRDGEKGSDRLGEAFVAHLARLRLLFTFYCARQSTATTRLVELQADPSHASYLKDRWDQIKPHTHAWNLDSMLIKPVQRVTKYPLLFDDLLACTTPVHPDYFSIRSAAEGCRIMAQEIDEAKRRKDVVAGVISKKPSGSGMSAMGMGSRDMAKTPSKKTGGLKLFRNNKLGGSGGLGAGSTYSLANLAGGSSNTLAPPLPAAMASTATLTLSPSDSGLPVLPRASFSEYRQLVEKMDEADHMTRRVGREVVHYTSAAKEVFVAQLAVVQSWERVVRLDMPLETGGGDRRLKAFRGIVEALIEGCWVRFNTEVKDNIIPVLSKLLDCSANPRKVMQKRDAKATDYARVAQARDKYRTSDRALLDSAREFVALHTQLVEELPAFLEGYLRIFDLAILAFSRAQAKYHDTVRERLEQYTARWVKPPRSPSFQSPKRNTVDLNDDAPDPALPDTSTIPGIVQAWSDAWAPYASAMDNFQITRPSRTMADRMASYSDRTGQLGHVRSRSGAGSPSSQTSGSGGRPDLKHSNSFSGSKQLSPASSLRRPGGGDGNRSRSTSLLAPSSGGAETFSNRRTATTAATSSNIDIPRHQPASDDPHIGNWLRASSSLDDDAVSADRLSFGLPRMSPSDNGTQFAGLGLGFTPQVSPALVEGSSSLQSLVSGGASQGYGIANGVEGLGLGMSDVSSPPRQGQRTPERRVSASGSGSVAVVPPTPPLGQQRRPSRPSQQQQQQQQHVKDDDAGEGWRNERVLYQCGVVADFDPSVVGSRRYRKLRFLPVITGDLIDVFYEVGRIDELPAFPYPEIGVENDGLLVGRKEDGDIGLVICSFLEPIV